MTRWLWPLAGLATALAWAVAAAYDQPVERAAAAAAAALVTVAITPRTLESTLAAAVLLGVFPLAMTRPGLLAAAVVIVAAVDLAANRRVDRAVNLVGAGLIATAAVADPHAAVALAGALLLLAGPSHLLMVPAVLVAWPAAAALPNAETEVAIACALAAAALAAFDRPGPAAAALGLPAAPLLLAGVLVRHRAATPALLPGAVALAGTLSTQRLTGATAALAGGLAAVAALTAWRRGPNPPPTPPDLAVLVLLGWLALAPTTWRWAGAVELDHYERGVAIGLATAAIAVVATSLRRSRHGTTSSTS